MATKRSFVPPFLFLLLSLSSLFLFSLHRSSLPVSESSPHSSKTFTPPQNPNPSSPNFVLTIKVLTFDRLPSLSRCLRSLGSADYGNDRVNLHIFIDHFKFSDPIENGSVDLDQKLNESRRILEFVDGFSWRFGDKLVHYRTGNVGLQAQWLESWWPSSDDEFAFVVEDDLEVSPLYYKFLKGLILNYYYNASNYSPYIYGASLQRPRFVPGKHGNKIQLDGKTRVFLYQLVGTWGQLLFPRPWKEFRLWYDTHKTKGIKPFLQGMVTTGWYRKMGERIWTPWFIKFIHSRGYFNIYTNFLHERALSVSHRDAGVNYGKTAGPDSNLLDEESLDFNLLELQPLSNLKWYNFCFKEVLPDRVVTSLDELSSILHSVQKLETVILVSLFGASETLVRNLLCHFESLNIQNYIFIGSTSSFTLDLSRRGHPVIDTDPFLDGIRAYKSTAFRESSERTKDILVRTHVIKKSLDLGYSSWVLDWNMIPVSNEFLVDASDPTNDFYISKTSKLFFVKSSSSSRKSWGDDFIAKVAKMADSLKSRERNFVYIVATLLEQKGVKIKRVDEMIFDVSVGNANVNRTSLGVGKKMAFWSSQVDLNLVRKRLEDLGMWIVDGDSSCTAVVCHQS